MTDDLARRDEQIKEMRKSGLTNSEIAQHVGVSKSRIGQIAIGSKEKRKIRSEAGFCIHCSNLAPPPFATCAGCRAREASRREMRSSTLKAAGLVVEVSGANCSSPRSQMTEDELAAVIQETIERRAERGVSSAGHVSFATMDKEYLRSIARKGGKASHASGNGHVFTSEEAKSAGRAGGIARHLLRGGEEYRSIRDRIFEALCCASRPMVTKEVVAEVQSLDGKKKATSIRAEVARMAAAGLIVRTPAGCYTLPAL